MKRFLISVLFVSAMGFLSANAATTTTSKETADDSIRLFERAHEVYRSIARGPHGELPASIRQNAKCIAVFPDIVTAALAVGGTSGKGVGFCRKETGGWSSPEYLDLSGGSLGVQAGVERADIVLFLTGNDARTALERGTFKMGANASVAAGTFDAAYNVPSEGVVAYSRVKGVYAGASLTGINLNRDENYQKAFYGANAPQYAFNSPIPAAHQKAVDDFRAMLP